jgi:hypothetical protein
MSFRLQVVPIQQSELLVRNMKEVGVPVLLVVKKGAGHFWNDHHNDRPHQHAWFKRYCRCHRSRSSPSTSKSLSASPSVLMALGMTMSHVSVRDYRVPAKCVPLMG